jgi:D-alanyl-D-alanine dipeptidase
VPAKPRRILKNHFAVAVFLAFFSASASLAQLPDALLPGPKPADAPLEWKRLVGIYLDEDSKHSFVLLEQGGKLFWRDEKGVSREFSVNEGIVFPPSEGGKQFGHDIVLGETGNITGLCYLNFCYSRTDPGSDSARTYHITPSKPVNDLRTAALAAKPPAESGTFRNPDLVELAPLDSSIHFDIRYATSNDFLGTPVYSQARAFLQRPAAEALLRVQQKLKSLGYGLLIHDAYRPWYVTKIFWDATPAEGKIFVADPAQGSRHNRGCAVDLTLYDLPTGKPIEMPGTYDEMSPRSFPDYPGGTSLQRWHRDLLRHAMESEGFTVYEAEWWHFDYKDWKEYAISNIPFEKIELGRAPATVHQ